MNMKKDFIIMYDGRVLSGEELIQAIKKKQYKWMDVQIVLGPGNWDWKDQKDKRKMVLKLKKKIMEK